MKFLLPFLVILNFQVLSARSDVDSNLYYTAYEKSLFLNYCNNKKIDTLRLMLAPDNSMDESREKEIRVKINNIIAEFRNRNLGKKSFVKQNEFFQNKVFKEFLLTYDQGATIADIFFKKTYCAGSAAALFDYILNQLNISHTIILKNDLAYIVFDNSSNFLMFCSLEEPDVKYEPIFKKNMTDYALKAGYNELGTAKANELFESLYLNDDDVNTNELLSLQYHQLGLNQMISKDYLNATYAFQKAEILSNSIKNEYLCYVSLTLCSQNNVFEPEQYLQILSKLYKYSSSKDVETLIIYSFEDYTRKYIIEKPDERRYDRIYNIISQGLKDSSIMEKVSFTYHFNKGHYYAAAQKPSQMFYEYLRAYIINPDHVGVKLSFNQLFKYEEGLDFLSLDSLDKIIQLSPAVIELQVIQNVYAFQCYNAIEEAIEKDDQKTIKDILDRYKLFYINIRVKDEIQKKALGRIYGTTSAYYYRMRNYKRAKTIAEEGLAMDPNNEELKRKVDIIKENSGVK